MAAKNVTVMLGGFVSIKTKFDVAVDKDGTSKDVHAVCTGNDETQHTPVRVRQSTSCPQCGTSASWAGAFPQRGVERDGAMVVLTAEELAGASGTPVNGRDVPIQLALHNREKVYAATLPSDGVHNVLPDKGSEKAYALLRDAMRTQPDLVGVSIWAPSSKNALWVFEVVDDRIVASKRCWPEDVRVAPAIAPTGYSDAESTMFAAMVEALIEDFDLGKYADEARANKADLIASKAGEAVAVSTPSAPGVPVGDLLAAIQATLDQKQPKKPARKRAAKKAVPKKEAAA